MGVFNPGGEEASSKREELERELENAKSEINERSPVDNLVKEKTGLEGRIKRTEETNSIKVLDRNSDFVI